MLSNVTAFIHASSAYPNIAGQPSLILEPITDRPILCNVIHACLDTQLITQLVIVTSDSEEDAIIEKAIRRYFPQPPKSILIHRIPAEKEYSFVPKRAKMYPVAFPYMWRPWYGLFSVNGYLEIVSQFKTDCALIIDPSQSATLSSYFLSHVIDQVHDKALFYGFTSPYRKLFAFSTSFMTNLINKNKSRLTSDIAQKGKISLLDDVFTLESDFNHKQYQAKDKLFFKQNFFPVLRKQEIELLRTFSDLNVDNFCSVFEAIQAQLYPLPLEYLEIELCADKGEERASNGILNVLQTFEHTGSVLNFTGSSDPAQNQHISEYISEAKKRGINSVWIETPGENLSAEKIRELISAGLDLLIIHANTFLDDHERLGTILSAFQRQRGAGLWPFVALLVETSPWLSSEQEEFIRRFESEVDRIVIQSVTASDPTIRGIDFSPNQRTICQQITNSAVLRANGNIALCARDTVGYISAQQLEGTLLSDQLHHSILYEQANGDFSKPFAPCESCKKWYIPNLKDGFKDIVISRELITLKKDTTVKIGSPAETEKRLNQIVERLSTAYERGCEESEFLEDIQRKCIHHLLMRQIKRGVHELKTRLNNIIFFKEMFTYLYIPIGEAYVAEGKYEEALRVWENVLHIDPSNHHIHACLDELSESNVPAK
jgi:hypothetical protein